MYRNVHPVFEAAIKKKLFLRNGHRLLLKLYTEMRK